VREEDVDKRLKEWCEYQQRGRWLKDVITKAKEKFGVTLKE
jgi:hypothetical protein